MFIEMMLFIKILGGGCWHRSFSPFAIYDHGLN